MIQKENICCSITCVTGVYRLGGVGLELGLTGKLGHAWVGSWVGAWRGTLPGVWHGVWGGAWHGVSWVGGGGGGVGAGGGGVDDVVGCGIIKCMKRHERKPRMHQWSIFKPLKFFPKIKLGPGLFMACLFCICNRVFLNPPWFRMFNYVRPY